MAKTLFSLVEQTILLTLTLAICFIFYTDLFNKAVDEYNEEVKIEQTRKMRLANDPKDIPVSFAVDSIEDFSSPPFWFLLYRFQFFYLPISSFLLKRQKVWSYIFSILVTSSSLYCFLNWTYLTFSGLKYAETVILKDKNFNQYILFQSTWLELFLFFLVLILFVLQIFILIRFTIEKFQARISIR